MTADEQQQSARGVGRPLDENVDQAILSAAWRLLLRDGYGGLSIAAVAEEARVGRPAIYRRYKDKGELIAATLADKQSRAATIDTGSARDDLIAYMEFSRRVFQVSLAGTILVDGEKEPELLQSFREGMLLPRIEEIVAAIERGKARGEVRADADSELAVHALMGSFMFHSLARDRPPPGWSKRVVDLIWRGIGA
jgi:AcrR family transcriptional regulator